MSLYSSITLSPIRFSLDFLICDILTSDPTHPPFKACGPVGKAILNFIGDKEEAFFQPWGLLFSKMQDANSASTGRHWNELHIPSRLPGESLFVCFKFIYLNWRLITLQYCGGFSHTLTWRITVNPDSFQSHLLAGQEWA